MLSYLKHRLCNRQARPNIGYLSDNIDIRFYTEMTEFHTSYLDVQI